MPNLTRVVSQAMDDEPIDATVGVGIGGIGHNNSAINNTIRSMEKNPITPNGSSFAAKFASNRNPNKFPTNDRNGSGNGTLLQPPAPQLSPTTFATAAAALATAAAANGISVNQLLTQVVMRDSPSQSPVTNHLITVAGDS